VTKPHGEPRADRHCEPRERDSRRGELLLHPHAERHVEPRERDDGASRACRVKVERSDQAAT
jgi:hypothetical protein